MKQVDFDGQMKYSTEIETDINFIPAVYSLDNNFVRQAGTYDINFNAYSLSSGIYYYTLRAVSTEDGKHDFTATKKMVYLK